MLLVAVVLLLVQRHKRKRDYAANMFRNFVYRPGAPSQVIVSLAPSGSLGRGGDKNTRQKHLMSLWDNGEHRAHTEAQV